MAPSKSGPGHLTQLYFIMSRGLPVLSTQEASSAHSGQRLAPAGGQPRGGAGLLELVAAGRLGVSGDGRRTELATVDTSS